MPANQYLVEHEVITGCRSCGSGRLHDVLDLGTTPLADRLLDDEMLAQPEPVCPLTVVVCETCGLMQIRETVPPGILFGGAYPYYSSVSEGLVRHFQDTVMAARRRRAVDGSSLVIELASNDGYLLRNYVEAGIQVLGIDPASGPVEVARSRGIETINDFFGERLADELADAGRHADIVHGNNVLAHVADTNGFVAGIAAILKPDGLVVIECPYVRSLLDACEFDTIYHQHLCYFSATAADTLFRRHGLFLNDVERVPIHGGSLRMFFSNHEGRSGQLEHLMAEEHAIGLDQPAYFRDFASRTSRLRDDLQSLVEDLVGKGNRLAGYGAAAKACTLLSYAGIGAGHLECLVDRSTFKQGKYFPGCHLPIRSPDWLVEAQPDYTLLLPWNFADEIIAQQHRYRDAGGRFIIPVPEPEIV